MRWWKVQQQASGRVEKKEITVCPSVTVVRCVTGDGSSSRHIRSVQYLAPAWDGHGEWGRE